jgi:hypothetical protein
MMPFTWDYGRLARTGDAGFHGGLTFGPLFYVLTLVVNAVVGISLARSLAAGGTLSELSAVQAIVGLTGIFGVALVWVGQTRINTANYYLASINAESFFARVLRLRLPRRVWVVIIGVAVFGLMLTDAISYLLKALQRQGVVVAWVAGLPRLRAPRSTPRRGVRVPARTRSGLQRRRPRRLVRRLRLASATEAGLVAFVYSTRADKLLRAATALECGMVGLNRGLVSDAAAPFGGTKQSGLGREGGELGLQEYLETKYVSFPAGCI